MASKRERPVLPTVKEVEAAKAKAVKPEKTLESREAALREKYSDKKITKGSIQFDSTHNKYSVEMRLECGHDERVFTSDVFQVKACHECKKAKSKEKLAALKAKAPKKDAPPVKGKVEKAAPAPKAAKTPAKAVKASPPPKDDVTGGPADDFAPAPTNGKSKKGKQIADLIG